MEQSLIVGKEYEYASCTGKTKGKYVTTVGKYHVFSSVYEGEITPDVVNKNLPIALVKSAEYELDEIIEDFRRAGFYRTLKSDILAWYNKHKITP